MDETSQWPYSPRLRRDRTNDDDGDDNNGDDDDNEDEDDESGGNVIFGTIGCKWENIKKRFSLFSCLGQGCISEESL